jgi:hypothetical protein
MPLYQIKYKLAGENVAKTTTIAAPDYTDAETEAKILAGKKGEIISVERSEGDD